MKYFTKYFSNTEILDEEYNVFGSQFVFADVASLDYHRIGSDFDSDYFEYSNNFGYQKYAGKQNCPLQLSRDQIFM